MILGTTAIRAALTSGAIICTPFPARIEGAHIDVTLGPYYWEFQLDEGQQWVGLEHADPRDYFTLRRPGFVEIPAHGFVLAHTAEYIGTASGSGLLPTLHTRSSLARWGLGCHPSAGWGDEGYASRWTLEIVNPHPVPIALPVGARVGCVAFERIEGSAVAYEGRYNASQQEWTPDHMLPRKGNL